MPIKTLLVRGFIAAIASACAATIAPEISLAQEPIVVPADVRVAAVAFGSPAELPWRAD